MARMKSTALTLLLLMTLFSHSVHSLNIGIQSSSVSVSRQCSRKCESQFCTVAPFLRYGKYCGILYSGCPGERPCDGLDACCKIHDDCVQSRHNDYLSQHCNRNFLNCITKFKNSGAPTFWGNKCSAEEVVDVISVVIEAALMAGRVLHDP